MWVGLSRKRQPCFTDPSSESGMSWVYVKSDFGSSWPLCRQVMFGSGFPSTAKGKHQWCCCTASFRKSILTGTVGRGMVQYTTGNNKSSNDIEMLGESKNLLCYALIVCLMHTLIMCSRFPPCFHESMFSICTANLCWPAMNNKSWLLLLPWPQKLPGSSAGHEVTGNGV